MIDTFKRYIQNLPGTRTNRKLIVIESDDWGSILMPNKQTFNKLKTSGYKPELNPYFKYDALASETDLEALFEVLRSVKDSNYNSAKLTANAVVANPNFKKIKQNNFNKYFYNSFVDTLKEYPEHKNSFLLWKQGMSENIFKPQYHGREHINIYQWMKGLKSDKDELRKAVDFEMIEIHSKQRDKRFSYMAGLDFFSKDEEKQKAEVLIDGMKIFIDLFGYKSKSFIANCYVWGSRTETTLNAMGVKYIQGLNSQVKPIFKDEFTTRHIFKKHYFGQKNSFGQRYLIRNIFFEPSLDPNKDWINDCLKRIDIAFKCKKPAIICSHRLNYIGFINENNRTQNLKLLQKLLKEVIKRWPDVEFISSDQLDSVF